MGHSAAEAGKHVLCEKPCAVSVHDLEAMLAACRANQVQFMDGVSFMHGPRLRRIRELLDDPTTLGQIRRISTMFSFAAGEDFFAKNIRVQSQLEPAGSLGDLGWYCIRFALWAMGWQMPISVTGTILSSQPAAASGPAVPVEFSGELQFEGGVSSGFFASFRSPIQQWAQVSGTKGWLRLDDFVLVDSASQADFKLNGSNGSVDTGPLSQISLMFEHFATSVASGKINEEWPLWSLKTQQVTDACLESARNGSRPVTLSA